MIKAIAEINNRVTLILGITRRNAKLLFDDKPIVVDLQALMVGAERLGDRKVQDIVIMAGETEEDMIDRLRELLPAAMADAEAGGRLQQYEENDNG